MEHRNIGHSKSVGDHFYSKEVQDGNPFTSSMVGINYLPKPTGLSGTKNGIPFPVLDLTKLSSRSKL